MFTQTEEEKLRGLIGAFENGKKITDLPEATSEKPEDYTVEVINEGESKSLNLGLLFPKEEPAGGDWYGVEFDTANPDPACTRIGTMDLHRTLPVHNAMKGCLLNDDGTVASYLPETGSWSSATLDGSAGQVMVEIPEYYVRFEEEGTIRRVKMATAAIDGFTKVPKCYVSAYHAAMDRTNNKLASVCNLTAQYRGGDNNAEWDGTYRELLGRPASDISLIDFSTAARARKADSTEWNTMTYEIWKNLYWLFVVEYATLNTQADYTAEPTAEGYHQGGLGAGVTTLSEIEWSDLNNYRPFVPCGYTNEFGNGTGVKSYIQSTSDEDASGAIEVSVPRYRGIETPFDHIGTWCDGLYIYLDIQDTYADVKAAIPLTTADMTKDLYIANGVLVGGELTGENPTQAWVQLFNDTTRFRTITLLHITDTSQFNGQWMGLLQKVVFGEYGDTLASELTIDGIDETSLTTYHCDVQFYYATQDVLQGLFPLSVVVGGAAIGGAYCGFSFADAGYVAAFSSADIGSRLCFIPA